MKKRNRTILWILIAALFLSITPLVLFYSQGYRFDFENKKFFQTGAFSFKILPRGALVFINDKLGEKTDFLFGTAYLDNLLPKRYKVEIKKEGYLPWEKTLEVKESWVTENKNIVLVPERPQFNSLKEKVDSFFFSPDGKRAVLKEGEGKNWTLFLYNPEKNSNFPLFSDKDFSKEGEKVSFITLEWAPDSKKILLQTKKEKNEYSIIEMDEEPKIFPLNFLEVNFIDISFGPKDSQIIFLTQVLKEKSSLFSVNYGEKSPSELILNDFLAFEVFNNRLFWLDKTGFLRQSDLSGNEIGLLNRTPLQLDNDSRLELVIFAEDKIFLKSGDNFYSLNVIEKYFEKISGGVKEVEISPDSKKIVYFTDYEIWLLFLEKIIEQPQREEGEKIFLARFSEKIGDTFWWTSHYLLFQLGNRVKITEIDDRDKINIYNLAEFEGPEIFWNQYDKKLYVLSQQEILTSERLIP